MHWIRRWVSYVLYSSGSLPGQIINDCLYMSISENSKLILGENVLMISQSLWSMFFAWYNGGPTLKWKIPIKVE